MTYTGNNRPIAIGGTLNKTGSGTITSSGAWTTIGASGTATLNLSNGTIEKSGGSGAIHMDSVIGGNVNVNENVLIKGTIYLGPGRKYI